MKVYEFNPVIYPFKLWIVVEKTPEGIPEHFLGHDNLPIVNVVQDTKKLAAFTMIAVKKENKHRGALMYFRSRRMMDFELVAHESSHAAKFLFDHIGAEIKDHEPFEYALGWIAGCCEKVKKDRTCKENSKMLT